MILATPAFLSVIRSDEAPHYAQQGTAYRDAGGGVGLKIGQRNSRAEADNDRQCRAVNAPHSFFVLVLVYALLTSSPRNGLIA